MKIIELNKINEEKWNNYIDRNPDSVFFHTLEWKEVVQEVYGLKPLYYLAIDEDDGGKVKGVLPAFFTNSIVFGKKIITTPFNFYNGALYDDEQAGKMLMKKLIKEGKDRGVKYVELKMMNHLDESVRKSAGLVKNEHYFISDLKMDIADMSQKYYKRLRKNLRTMHKKAEKDNYIIRDLKNQNDLKQFYGIMVKVLRDKHNMISQPYDLFNSLFKKLFKKKMIKILLMQAPDKTVAGGMVMIFHKNRCVYAWGAADMKHKTYSISTLLVDTAIRYCKSKGIKSMDFGVTSPYHEELLVFKNKWGCDTKKLPYYYKLINTKEIPSMDYHTSFKTLRKPFRFVPVPIIKLMSPIITKQLT